LRRSSLLEIAEEFDETLGIRPAGLVSPPRRNRLPLLNC